jgi:hypothetical protein
MPFPVQRRNVAPIRSGNPLLSLQQGTYGTGGEVLDKTYYDTITLATATTVYRMFQTPEGQGTPAKTKDITNMTAAGTMPQGQNLKVKSIHVQYVTHAAIGTATVQKIINFLNHTTCEISIPGKDNIGDWTLAELMGNPTLIALTPTAAGDNIPIAFGTFTGVKKLLVPIVLSALTTFEFRVTPVVASDAALDGDFLRVGFRGILRRSS